MFGFQLSKWFWNLWDHLLVIILLNLLFILGLGGGFYVLRFTQVLQSWPLTLFVGSLALFVFIVLEHAIALSCYSIAKLDRNDWKESLKGAVQKKSLLAAGLFQVCFCGISIILFVSWRFYIQQQNFISFMALSLLFWMILFLVLCMGFYFPMLVREEFHFLITLRRIFIVCLDNILLSFALVIIAIILFSLSIIPPFMLFFGPIGLNLWYEVSLRILYYKYQYLKEQQDGASTARRIKKSDIPWRVLLRDERERIGPRSLRNFIFPWKD